MLSIQLHNFDWSNRFNCPIKEIAKIANDRKLRFLNCNFLGAYALPYQGDSENDHEHYDNVHFKECNIIGLYSQEFDETYTLTNLTFKNCKFIDCNFKASDMSQAEHVKSKFIDCQFGIDFEIDKSFNFDVNTFINNNKFENCTFQIFDLNGAEIPKLLKTQIELISKISTIEFID